MRLRTLYLGMRARRFRSPFVRSFGGCCLSWLIFFRRLWVFLLLLLLLGLCSRISLAPLFLHLLSTSRGSRGSARLADADAHLAAFLSSGRSGFSFLPPRNSSILSGYFASGQVVLVNPSLLSQFEK